MPGVYCSATQKQRWKALPGIPSCCHLTSRLSCPAPRPPELARVLRCSSVPSALYSPSQWHGDRPRSPSGDLLKFGFYSVLFGVSRPGCQQAGLVATRALAGVCGSLGCPHPSSSLTRDRVCARNWRSGPQTVQGTAPGAFPRMPRTACFH